MDIPYHPGVDDIFDVIVCGGTHQECRQSHAESITSTPEWQSANGPSIRMNIRSAMHTYALAKED